ncbi:PREDICTED: pumilio domain-containing protein KIAA0020 homolog isoform X1 [Vollenhovia emeryi]|nr:PREDICTED: pumilio domain-containing protein KIAA0020 homolog isoform X1 [Vollenhovia emeryi]XP_011865615.1 PREDICTED: pumilio domain-containing protein KIAA0020 homolog isoform X1 [Vollenhovia emeryi]XP_011865616.1 PREDICTED: pumilio domain-containing protein KIAA0020 homolog isoform X1 [Vollenhovia emeryi]
MKRSATSLEAGDARAEDTAGAGDNKKRKKVRFEKSLDNKPAGKAAKPSLAKANAKGTNLKAAKNSSTIKKIDLLKRKREGKKLGQKSKEDKSGKETSEKTDWVKLKKEKKELRQKRKAKRLNDDVVFDKIVQAKRIGEKLRRSDCKSTDRVTLTRTLHGMLENHYGKVIFAHDMSRVVQCMIKYCDEHTRQAIFRETKPLVVEMLQSKYAKNCVKAILKYGSQEIRSAVISGFCGNIVKLMSHSVSASLVELAYCTWCTKLDKIRFKQEFYGDMYKLEKDNSVKSLSDVYKVATDMKLATLSAVKANVIRILNKGLVNSTLLQTVLWEFLCACSTEDRSELIVTLRSYIITLCQTKMGTRVATQCMWHGNSKDRKFIMKALKGNVKAICASKYGHMLLLALFDSVDDTVLVQKIILSELQEDLVNIALNEYGKHVLSYLVARRKPLYFSPDVVEYLRQGDDNSWSKKLADVREGELLEAIRGPLFDAVIADTATWLSNGGIAMTTLAILKVGSGEKLNSAFESIAKFLTDIEAKIKENDSEFNVVEHPGLHVMLKKLIQNDKELVKKNESTFGEILISHLTPEVLEKWTEFNRSCFLLILLIENECEDVKDMLLSKLKPLTASLKTKRGAGASILLKKLE